MSEGGRTLEVGLGNLKLSEVDLKKTGLNDSYHLCGILLPICHVSWLPVLRNTLSTITAAALRSSQGGLMNQPGVT
jgi:hypothetical protein